MARAFDRWRDLAAPLAAAAIAACGLAPPSTPQGPATSPPPPAADPQALPPPGYRLVWSDEFEGTAVDPTRWRVATGPRRDAVNTRDAVAVQGGALRLTVSTEAGVHETGYLDSDGRFDATHGFFEARIRFRSAPGEWCAFWLVSGTIGRPMGDPARAGVEIDVVEHRVTDDGGWALQDHVALNLNWDGYGPERRNAQVVTTLPGAAPVQGEWHVYAVLWTATSYTFYVDGTPLWVTGEAVSQRSEWLNLTCEVDDASWAGFIPPAGYGPRATSATGMEVDWVRVWQAPP